MPIYYIVAEYIPSYYQYQIMHILAVHKTTVEEAMSNDFYQKAVAPYFDNHRQIASYMFLREEDNPFREWNSRGDM